MSFKSDLRSKDSVLVKLVLAYKRHSYWDVFQFDRLIKRTYR